MRHAHVLIAMLWTASAAAAPEPSTHTRVIAATCMACHGPGGRSVSAMPSLAGMPQAEFVQTMKAFQSGAREATIMKRHAAGYTDAEIDAMAAYFSALN